jgi:cell wall-associated NlpC family hydrolase
VDIMRLALACILFVPAAALAMPDPEALDHPQFHALLALGAPYRAGAASPEQGFDCSGLVAHVFDRAWGVTLPRRAEDQARLGKPVRKRDLEPGDLVFYNTLNRPYSHVGIYVGDGRFIHAPSRGKRVRAERMDSPYWVARFNGARRIAKPSPLVESGSH